MLTCFYSPGKSYRHGRERSHRHGSCFLWLYRSKNRTAAAVRFISKIFCYGNPDQSYWVRLYCSTREQREET